MGKPLRIDVITIFPAMLEGFLGESICRRAQELGAVEYHITNLRDFTTDRHRTVDDRPYGGGPGMVMKPDPFFKAVDSVRTPDAKTILMCPKGRRFDQTVAREFSFESHLIFLCGHYEGVDQRVSDVLADDQISIGDYVLTNGVLAAAVVIDAVVRLLPNVLSEGSVEDESFQGNRLEYPQYTRPAAFGNMKVPEVLLSGDHAQIAKWRDLQAKAQTFEKRPDLQKKTAKEEKHQ
jgi:tRNA (guanine37-N1)-methyltransferase